MSLKVTQLTRLFVSEDGDKKLPELTLPDPGAHLSPEEVLDHYSSEYPELSNSFVVPGEVKGDIMYYTIRHNFGDKG